MRYPVMAVAFCALTAPALAQVTPPSQPAPPSPATADAPSSPTISRTGRGAFIKMQGPGGTEIAVRCADGETTRACADVVTQLLDRVRGAAPERRRDMDRGERGDRGGEYRFRDREY